MNPYLFNIRSAYRYVYIVVVFFGHIPFNQAQTMNDSIVKDDSFLIAEVPEDFYEGRYKNNKPFAGYFKKGNEDFYMVDFYENGTPVYQYSFDIVDQITREESNDEAYESRTVLPIKSVYKKGQIYTGVSPQFVEQGILTQVVKQGTITGFHLDVFAMHYFNRIVYKKDKEGIRISTLKDKNHFIEVRLAQNHWVVELYKDGKIIHRIQILDAHTATFPKDSKISTYKDKNGVLKYAYSEDKKEMESVYQENPSMMYLLRSLPLSKTSSYPELFEYVIHQYVTKGMNIDAVEETAQEKIYYINSLITDDLGNISSGIRFVEDELRYEIFKDNQVIKNQQTTLEAFQTIFLDYINTANERGD